MESLCAARNNCRVLLQRQRERTLHQVHCTRIREAGLSSSLLSFFEAGVACFALTFSRWAVGFSSLTARHAGLSPLIKVGALNRGFAALVTKTRSLAPRKDIFEQKRRVGTVDPEFLD